MKKKLFLLPIVLFSSFLGACEYRTEFIPLKDIFTIEKGNSLGSCRYNDKQQFDYDDSLLNILKTYTSDAEAIGIEDGSTYRYNIKTINYSFNISSPYKKMDYFSITIYETGDIETNVYGSGWPVSPRPQRYLYKISDETTSELFEKVDTRITEITTILEVEKEEAKEASTIDKFLAAYSALENRKVIYSYSGHDSRVKRPYVREIDIPDKDGEYLELIEDLEYKRYGDDVTYGFDEYIHVSSSDCIKVNANEGWCMTLDYKEATGYMYYEYKSKYQGLGSYIYYFSVNQSKINALYEKIYNEINNQIE